MLLRVYGTLYVCMSSVLFVGRFVCKSLCMYVCPRPLRVYALPYLYSTVCMAVRCVCPLRACVHSICMSPLCAFLVCPVHVYVPSMCILSLCAFRVHVLSCVCRSCVCPFICMSLHVYAPSICMFSLCMSPSCAHVLSSLCPSVCTSLLLYVLPCVRPSVCIVRPSMRMSPPCIYPSPPCVRPLCTYPFICMSLRM